MTSITIYSHPDGHEIHCERNVLTACTAEGVAVSIPIGSPANVLALAEALTAIANDAGNLAEQAGAEAAIDALSDMAATDDRGERIATLQSAILGAMKSPHPERFAGGLAVVLAGTFGLEGDRS